MMKSKSPTHHSVLHFQRHGRRRRHDAHKRRLLRNSGSEESGGSGTRDEEAQSDPGVEVGVGAERDNSRGVGLYAPPPDFLSEGAGPGAAGGGSPAASPPGAASTSSASTADGQGPAGAHPPASPRREQRSPPPEADDGSASATSTPADGALMDQLSPTTAGNVSRDPNSGGLQFLPAFDEAARAPGGGPQREGARASSKLRAPFRHGGGGGGRASKSPQDRADDSWGKLAASDPSQDVLRRGRERGGNRSVVSDESAPRPSARAARSPGAPRGRKSDPVPAGGARRGSAHQQSESESSVPPARPRRSHSPFRGVFARTRHRSRSPFGGPHDGASVASSSRGGHDGASVASSSRGGGGSVGASSRSGGGGGPGAGGTRPGRGAGQGKGQGQGPEESATGTTTATATRTATAAATGTTTATAMAAGAGAGAAAGAAVGASGATSLGGASAGVGAAARRRAAAGGKVSRLAKLFSSRAAVNGADGTAPIDGFPIGLGTDHMVPNHHRQWKAAGGGIPEQAPQQADQPPLSPGKSVHSVHSASLSHASTLASGTSSAHYVNWPGTQDRRGRTVVIAPSFSVSESDAESSRQPFRDPGTDHAGGGGGAAAPARGELHGWIDGDDVVGDSDDSSSCGSGGGGVRGFGGRKGLSPVQRVLEAMSDDESTDGEDSDAGDGVEVLDDGDGVEVLEHPADFHLAAALAEATGSPQPKAPSHLAAALAGAGASPAPAPSPRSGAEAASPQALRPPPVDVPRYNRARGWRRGSPAGPKTTGLSPHSVGIEVRPRATPSPSPSPGPSPSPDPANARQGDGQQGGFLSPFSGETPKYSGSPVVSPQGMMSPLIKPQDKAGAAPSGNSGGGKASSPGSINIQNLFAGSSGDSGKPADGDDVKRDLFGDRAPAVSPPGVKDPPAPDPRDPWDGGRGAAGASPPAPRTPLERKLDRNMAATRQPGIPGIDISGSARRVREAQEMGSLSSSAASGASSSGAGAGASAAWASPVGGARARSSPAGGARERSSPVGGAASRASPVGKTAAAAAAAASPPPARGAQQRRPTSLPEVRPLSAEALAARERLSPPAARVNPATARGYRGFLDRTRDVPNLMDEVESDSSATMSTLSMSQALSPVARRAAEAAFRSSSPIAEGIESFSASGGGSREGAGAGRGGGGDDCTISGSDVFDGLSSVATGALSHGGFRVPDEAGLPPADDVRTPPPKKAPQGEGPPRTSSPTNVVKLGSNLAAIQTSPEDFAHRYTSQEFDADLTDTDAEGHRRTNRPGAVETDVGGGFPDMAGSPNAVPPTFRTEAFPPQRRHRRQNTFDETLHAIVSAENNETTTDSSDGGGGGSYRRSTQYDDSSDSSSESSGESPSSASGSSGSFGMGAQQDLSIYYVEPHAVRQLVRKYRKMCRPNPLHYPPICSDQEQLDALESEEDAKKAFALFEMRSRVMETDIERGLERRGGTVPVDDLVTTPYNRAAHRIRDAVIVSKAWRDGATPRDVVTASNLTRRAERTYYVRRRADPRSSRAQGRPGSPQKVGVMRGPNGEVVRFTLEEVRWVDDADFALMRCPSLGPRHMRGFEMFTIGDCQSILLKLTNECVCQLRKELNDATARQIEAEEIMKEEEALNGPGGDPFLEDSSAMMTDAEMTYLAAMEEVKTVSKRLVVAEKSFQLVRDRIERLVARYEILLVKMNEDDESLSAGGSFGSSDYVEDYRDADGADGDGGDDEDPYDDVIYDTEEERDREKEMLAKRAQRAELRAEVAAREALLAQQEVEKVRVEKQRELEELQKKLADLETKTQVTASSNAGSHERKAEYERFLAQNGGTPPAPPAAGGGGGSASGSGFGASEAMSYLRGAEGSGRGGGAADPAKLEARERIKAKFRSRHAERVQRRGPLVSGRREGGLVGGAARPSPLRSGSGGSLRDLDRRLAGEEMYQQMDFYERSLRAVENNPVD